MATRTRHQPLYEAIRGRGTDLHVPDSTSLTDADEPSAPSPAGRGEYERSGLSLASWMARAHSPIVLRVPRGMAILIGVVVLAFIFLAYWVGYQQAQFAQSAAPSAVPGDVESYGQGRADRRIEGLTYFVLAEFPASPDGRNDARGHAEDLVGFLRDQAVEAKMVIGHNKGLRVVALTGFRDDQIASADYQKYQQELSELGRRWKQVHGGLTDFSMMKPEKYTGESVAGPGLRSQP